MSMTMYEREDPHFHDHRCMKCDETTPSRVVSTFANELRLFLCTPCQSDLGWCLLELLGPAPSAELAAARADDGRMLVCRKCHRPEHCKNRSALGALTLDLCPDCQVEVTAFARRWLAPFSESTRKDP